MKTGPTIFIGAFLAFLISFQLIIAKPQAGIGQQDIVEAKWSGERYPANPPGQSKQGAEVYRSLGCASCHSQQVRGNEADLTRWGVRRTVAQDYLFDTPVQLGENRIGPDLANVGARIQDENWHYLHLFNPRSVVEKSVMPPYRFLFDVQERGSAPAGEALALPEGFPIEPGYEIVPTDDARALVAYLLGRKYDVGLEEAPLPVVEEETDEPETVVTETSDEEVFE